MGFGQVLMARRLRFGMHFVGAPILLMGLLTSMTPAAGETARKAVLEVEVRIEDGRERWKNGSEWKDGAFSQSYTLNIPYLATPSLDNINPYDPEYNAAFMKTAAEAQSQAIAIARQEGGQTANPFNTVLDPGKMIQVDPERIADLAARLQACNGDRACFMKTGLELMAQNATGQDAATIQVMQEIGDECSRTFGQGDSQKFDACMQEKGSKYAMIADEVEVTDTGSGFTEPAPDRFQRWEMDWDADGGCGATIVANYRYEAADMLNDIAGPAAGNETAIGASEGGVVPSEMPIVCSSNQIITDVLAKKIYIQSFYMPTVPVRQTIDSKLRGGHLESTVPGGLPIGPDIENQWAVAQWIAEKLSGAPLSGHEERFFKIKGNMNGVSLPTAIAGVPEIVPDETDPTAWKRQAPNFHETEFVAKVTWRLMEIRQ